MSMIRNRRRRTTRMMRRRMDTTSGLIRLIRSIRLVSSRVRRIRRVLVGRRSRVGTRVISIMHCWRFKKVLLKIRRPCCEALQGVGRQKFI
jgi:hypothetical protein